MPPLVFEMWEWLHATRCHVYHSPFSRCEGREKQGIAVRVLLILDCCFQQFALICFGNIYSNMDFIFGISKLSHLCDSVLCQMNSKIL